MLEEMYLIMSIKDSTKSYIKSFLVLCILNGNSNAKNVFFSCVTNDDVVN